jgi:hypothetical protein
VRAARRVRARRGAVSAADRQRRFSAWNLRALSSVQRRFAILWLEVAMIRVSTLAIAAALVLAVGGCKNNQKRSAGSESAMGSMAPAGSTRTSAAPSPSAAASASSTATTTTSSANGTLDTARRKAGAAASKMKSAARSGAAAAGSAASSAALRTRLAALSHDQLKELQTALNKNGCNAGPVDGISGPKTRQGVECGLRKNNISGNDLNALYKALNLNIGS